jgi:hypothetical protein
MIKREGEALGNFCCRIQTQLNFRLSRRLDRSVEDLSLSETLSINLGHFVFVYKGENKKLVKIRRFHDEFQII